MAKDKLVKQRPAQHQKSPGKESKMKPLPEVEKYHLPGSGKLLDKVAIITGGDSGIGRAVAVNFAKEGGDVVVIYLKEHKDAQETKRLVEEKGRSCLLIAGDVSKESFCKKAATKTIKEFGKIDILVNNAAEQHPEESIENITAKNLQDTFSTNIFGYFFMVKAVLPYLIKSKGTIINTASVTAYQGHDRLLDYSSTKGAIVSFTRSLSKKLVEKGIRVNGVAPGPIWTPLIVSTYPAKKVATFGSNVPMKRAGQPSEVATCFVFLASDDSSYITGQLLHPNGGVIVGS